MALAEQEVGLPCPLMMCNKHGLIYTESTNFMDIGTHRQIQMF